MHSLVFPHYTFRVPYGEQPTLLQHINMLNFVHVCMSVCVCLQLTDIKGVPSVLESLKLACRYQHNNVISLIVCQVFTFTSLIRSITSQSVC